MGGIPAPHTALNCRGLAVDAVHAPDGSGRLAGHGAEPGGDPRAGARRGGAAAQHGHARSTPGAVRAAESLWAGFGRRSSDRSATADEDTGDQAFHVDFGNNSLVVPKRSSPDAVAALLYCSDVEEAGAPTHAAPAHPGELTTYGVEAPFIPPSSLTHLNSPELMDRLYKEERPVRYRLGTILLYRLDAFKLIDLC